MWDFASNQEVDSIEKVPADFRPFYEEADGKAKLKSSDPVVAAAVKTITGQGKSLDSARKEAADYKAKIVDLSSLSEFGATPEEIRAGIDTKLEELRKDAKGKGADVEARLKAQQESLTAAHQKDLESANARNKGLQDQLYQHLATNQLLDAMNDPKHKAHKPKLVLPHAIPFVKVEEKDGKFEPVVVKENGEVRYGPTGAPMTPRELIAEMAEHEDYSMLFESKRKEGGNTPTNLSRNPPKPGDGPINSVDMIEQGLAETGMKGIK